MSDFTLATENSRQRVYVRSWKPGDGLTCSHAKMAPRELPCTEPVAVTVTEEKRDRGMPTGGWSRSETRRILCRNHAPGLIRPNQINADAKKAAAERLVVEHWETYQQYLREEVRARQDKALEFADAEIRRIVLGESQ